MPKSRHFFLANALAAIGLIFFLIGLSRTASSILFHVDAIRISILLMAGSFLISQNGNFIFHFLKKVASLFAASSAARVGFYIFWSATWGATAVLKHLAIHTADFDVGVFGQTLQSLANGNYYQQTVDVPISYLAVHQNFTLAVFAPLFWLPYSTELLLFSQAFLLFSPALLLTQSSWKFLDKTTTNGKILFLFAYFGSLFAPPILFNTIWEWHETTIVLPALTIWTIALVQGRLRMFVIASLVIGLTKENLLITLIPGLFCFPLMHRRQRSLFITIAIALFFVGLFIFERKWLSELNYSVQRYEWLGDSPGNVIKAILFEPNRWITTLTTRSRLEFIRNLLALGAFGVFWAPFVSFFAWTPILLSHLLSSREAQYLMNYHYVLEVWPIVLVFSLVGWRSILNSNNKRGLFLIPIVLFLWIPGPNLFEEWGNLLPDAQINRPMVKQIETELKNSFSHCDKAPSGIVGKWMFPQIYEDYNVYPVDKIELLNRKHFFTESILSRNGGCAFLLGQTTDKEVIELDLSRFGFSLDEISKYKISDYSIPDGYRLYYLYKISKMESQKPSK